MAIKDVESCYLGPNLEHNGTIIHRLGVHEPMYPEVINRPQGRNDHLLLLFMSPIMINGIDYNETLNDGSPLAHMIYWELGQRHHYGHTQQTWNHHWVHCSGTLTEQLCHRLISNRVYPIHNPAPLTRHFRYLSDCARLDRDALSAINALHNLFHRAQHDAESNNTDVPSIWQDFRCFLDSHLHESLDLNQMAEFMHCSRTSLFTHFKQWFGVSPTHYHHERRMEHAKWLLQGNSLSITEIGAQLGYSDPAYFSRVIKKHFGKSPRDLR